MDHIYYILIPLLVGWFADSLLGDPSFLPHPIVGFGKIISLGEKRLNNGNDRVCKGAFFAVSLIALTFYLCYELIKFADSLEPLLAIIISTILVFYCLAGRTLRKEVKNVFEASNESISKARKQVSRIVGRDTSELSIDNIRRAALETLAENLSDGVIAPLFYFAVLGVPGMVAYKMINTLDSMIGYKNDRYYYFGRWAARIDDIANYIPARITAFLIVLAQGIPEGSLKFVKKYGTKHSSPNSGYPEAALASILDCRFGGPNKYFGREVEKPFIGTNEREITMDDMKLSIAINEKAEIIMVIAVLVVRIII
ncbi:MAG: adenosylcobinamide-phosphate synthase CbiB [Bacteroidales bacterium]|nr:adenosylcobinamide-phosphate synthase CbiB [Bacteroidales bacterium]